MDFWVRAWRSLGAFRSAYAWLLRDLIKFSRRRVVAVLALNLLGVLLQWAVVGAVLVFVGKLTGEGGVFQVPLFAGLDFSVEPSTEVVAAWGAIVLLMVIGSALFAYRAEGVGFETARRYVAHRGRDILRATLETPSRPVDDTESTARALQLLLGRDLIMILRALLVVQRSLRSVMMVAVAAVVLGLINPVLSAVVLAVVVLFVAPYYLVNQSVVAAAAAVDRRNADARLSVRRLAEHATDREPSTEAMRVVPELYPSDRAINDRLHGLRDLILGAQRTTALMTGLVGTCLVAVVVAFGVIIARDEASWVAALSFIIALNLGSTAFVQLASQVTAANRFLPHVQAYMGFTDRLGSAREERPRSLAAPSGRLPPLRTPMPIMAGSERELHLSAVSRVLCVSPEPIDRLNVYSLLYRLVGNIKADARQLWEATFFCGDSLTLPPVRVRDLVGAHGMDAIVRLGLAREIEQLPQQDETVLTQECQERLTPFMRYALGVAEGIGGGLLVLGWTAFSRLTPDDRRSLLSVAQQPIIFVTSRTPVRQPSEITHTVIITERAIAGMGNRAWYASVTDGLTPQSSSGDRSAGVAPSNLDELALEE